MGVPGHTRHRHTRTDNISRVSRDKNSDSGSAKTNWECATISPTRHTQQLCGAWAFAFRGQGTEIKRSCFGDHSEQNETMDVSELFWKPGACLVRVPQGAGSRWFLAPVVPFVRSFAKTYCHSACSAAKSIGQSVLTRTMESAGLILSQIYHSCLLPHTLNMQSDRM